MESTVCNVLHYTRLLLLLLLLPLQSFSFKVVRQVFIFTFFSRIIIQGDINLIFTFFRLHVILAFTFLEYHHNIAYLYSINASDAKAGHQPVGMLEVKFEFTVVDITFNWFHYLYTNGITWPILFYTIYF